MLQPRKDTNRSQTNTGVQELMKKKTLFKGFSISVWVVIVLEKSVCLFLVLYLSKGKF